MSTDDGHLASWMPLWEWRVRNFKAIEEANLQLAPLTLLVGPNSSGKSSILQSILLMVQAAQAEAEGSAFPLNGPLASLGSYQDVRSTFSKTPVVSMGGNFVFNHEDLPLIEGRPIAFKSGFQGRTARPRRRRPLRPAALDVEISFDRKVVDEATSAEISAVRAELGSDDEAVTHLQLHATRRGEGPSSEEEALLEEGRLIWPTREHFSLGFWGHLEYGGTPDPDTMGQEQADEGNLALRGLSLKAGLPHNVLVEWQSRALAAQAWVEHHGARTLWRGRLGPIRAWATPEGRLAPEGLDEPSTDESRRLEALASRAAEDINAWLQPRLIERYSLGRFLIESERRMSSQERTLIRTHSPHLIGMIQSRLGLEGQVFAPAEFPVASALDDAASRAHEFLRERVVYLGPIREDPQVAYRGNPVGATGYIGPKGQYLAAVLHANRTRPVACPTEDGSLQRMRLTEALDYWAERLAIAETVSTTDLGRLGIQILVSREGIEKLDLTSVGVGVSQLLPVIVMCLLAPPGSLILLEQPELHLHPALQQKLGDFLIACSKGGRQLIVETHSEYLVSRLRRRIAEAPSNELVGRIALYFAEQANGVSRIREVELNELGGIDDWPDGFFDQSADEARRILEAGLGKKLDPARSRDVVTE